MAAPDKTDIQSQIQDYYKTHLTSASLKVNVKDVAAVEGGHMVTADVAMFRGPQDTKPDTISLRVLSREGNLDWSTAQFSDGPAKASPEVSQQDVDAAAEDKTRSPENDEIKKPMSPKAADPGKELKMNQGEFITSKETGGEATPMDKGHPAAVAPTMESRRTKNKTVPKVTQKFDEDGWLTAEALLEDEVVGKREVVNEQEKPEASDDGWASPEELIEDEENRRAYGEGEEPTQSNAMYATLSAGIANALGDAPPTGHPIESGALRESMTERNRDGTGPEGKGPRTGRGMGSCPLADDDELEGADTPESAGADEESEGSAEVEVEPEDIDGDSGNAESVEGFIRAVVEEFAENGLEAAEKAVKLFCQAQGQEYSPEIADKVRNAFETAVSIEDEQKDQDTEIATDMGMGQGYKGGEDTNVVVSDKVLDLGSLLDVSEGAKNTSNLREWMVFSNEAAAMDFAKNLNRAMKKEEHYEVQPTKDNRWILVKQGGKMGSRPWDSTSPRESKQEVKMLRSVVVTLESGVDPEVVQEGIRQRYPNVESRVIPADKEDGQSEVILALSEDLDQEAMVYQVTRLIEGNVIPGVVSMGPDLTENDWKFGLSGGAQGIGGGDSGFAKPTTQKTTDSGPDPSPGPDELAKVPEGEQGGKQDSGTEKVRVQAKGKDVGKSTNPDGSDGSPGPADLASVKKDAWGGSGNSDKLTKESLEEVDFGKISAAFPESDPEDDVPEEPAGDYDMVGQMMAYEQGELGGEDTVQLLSQIVMQGMLRGLQGHYGRAASALMQQGIIDAQGNINEEALRLALGESMDGIDSIILEAEDAHLSKTLKGIFIEAMKVTLKEADEDEKDEEKEDDKEDKPEEEKPAEMDTEAPQAEEEAPVAGEELDPVITSIIQAQASHGVDMALDVAEAYMSEQGMEMTDEIRAKITSAFSDFASESAVPEEPVEGELPAETPVGEPMGKPAGDASPVPLDVEGQTAGKPEKENPFGESVLSYEAVARTVLGDELFEQLAKAGKKVSMEALEKIVEKPELIEKVKKLVSESLAEAAGDGDPIPQDDHGGHPDSWQRVEMKAGSRVKTGKIKPKVKFNGKVKVVWDDGHEEFIEPGKLSHVSRPKTASGEKAKPEAGKPKEMPVKEWGGKKGLESIQKANTLGKRMDIAVDHIVNGGAFTESELLAALTEGMDEFKKPVTVDTSLAESLVPAKVVETKQEEDEIDVDTLTEEELDEVYTIITEDMDGEETFDVSIDDEE